MELKHQTTYEGSCFFAEQCYGEIYIWFYSKIILKMQTWGKKSCLG